jgi:hypothetical protein
LEAIELAAKVVTLPPELIALAKPTANCRK